MSRKILANPPSLCPMAESKLFKLLGLIFSLHNNLTLEKLVPVNMWNFCLENNSNK